MTAEATITVPRSAYEALLAGLEDAQDRVVASAVDEQHLYRIVRLDGGYLLTTRMRSRAGMLLGPAEWRFRTEVAARAMLQALQSFNRLWMAFTSGRPIVGLERDAAAAQDRANAAMVQLDDHPLVGDEVRDLRLRVEASLGDDAAP